MSAYRQAMLSVPPDRLEQFSLEHKQNIGDKKKKKERKRSGHSSDRNTKRKKSPSSSKRNKKSDKSDKSSRSKTKSASEKVRDRSKRRKKSKERRKSHNSEDDEEQLTGDSDVEESGLDLKHTLNPLSHYVKNRRELMDQVFKIVKEPKFSAMLPDILKNVPTEELQALCYNKLEVMSTKRLVCVLSGEAMQSSSGTDSSDTENGREAQPKPLTKPKDSSIVQKNFVDSTTSSGCEVLSLLADGSKVEVRSSSDHVVSTSQAEEGSSSDDSANAEDGETVSEHGEAVVSQSAPDAASDEELEMVEDIVEIEEEADYQDLVDAMLEESLPENKETSVEKDKESELSQLEILELQLRARAIKSLMRNVQSTVDDG